MKRRRRCTTRDPLALRSVAPQRAARPASLAAPTSCRPASARISPLDEVEDEVDDERHSIDQAAGSGLISRKSATRHRCGRKRRARPCGSLGREDVSGSGAGSASGAAAVYRPIRGGDPSRLRVGNEVRGEEGRGELCREQRPLSPRCASDDCFADRSSGQQDNNSVAADSPTSNPAPPNICLNEGQTSQISIRRCVVRTQAN